LNIGKAKVRSDFKNWNNSIGFNFKPLHGKIFRRIVYQTVAQTFQQDQILRDIIENKEHLDTEKFVAIDVEYGGGKTVPRVGIVNFNEECVYYSDFALRYNDWEETKKLLKEEREKSARAAEKILERNRLIGENSLSKIAKEEYYKANGGNTKNASTKAASKSSQKQKDTSDSDDEEYDEIDKEFDQNLDKEFTSIKEKTSNFSYDQEGKKVYSNSEQQNKRIEESKTSMQEIFSNSKRKRFESKLDYKN
jgi:hypothetical protein